jgi:hypothetical protein
MAVVIGVYHARPGREAETEALLRRHVPTLRRLGLATDRLGIVLRTPTEAVFLELFEWSTADAVDRAHGEAAVQEIWEALESAAEFVSLSHLPQSDKLFPLFEPVAWSLYE